jgi:glycosyltransferase involved in cell wall biosynthesis
MNEMRVVSDTGSRQLRICLVSIEYPPETNWGGIGTFTYDMAHAFSQKGYMVHVISLSLNGNTYSYHDKSVIVHRVWPLTRKSAESSAVGYIGYVLAVHRKIQELYRDGKIDIVEFPDYGASGLLSSISRSIPMVVRMHGPSFLTERINQQRRTLKSRVRNYLEKFTSRHSNGVISVSKALADMVKSEMGIIGREITVIPNPIDTNYYRPDLSSRHDRDKKFTILYVGRIEMLKGVHILLEAFMKVEQTIQNAKLILVGPDTNTGRDGGSFKEHLVRTMPFSSKKCVEFVGPLNRSDLLHYYLRSSVCVVPSLWEPFGIVCLEAMACGKPVIAANIGGIPEIIDDGIDGLLFHVGDVEDLKMNIIKLYSSSDLIKEIGMKARNKVQLSFSQDIIADQVINYYRKLV